MEKKQETATQAPPVPAAEKAEVKADAAETKEKAVKVPAPAAVGRGKGSRPKQCTQCSKNLKKKTWYYRDNKYFCNKRCWKASKTPKAAAAA